MLNFSTGIITNSTIIDIVQQKMSHNNQLNKWEDYYNGDHEILSRKYPDPDRPNNRVVINYCKQGADFATAYLTGEAIEYLGANEELKLIQAFNDDSEVNSLLNSDMNVYGFASELLFYDELNRFNYVRINPKESIFIYDDSIRPQLIYYMRLWQSHDDDFHLEVYDNDNHTSYRLNKSLTQVISRGQSKPHGFDEVPAIIYKRNESMSSLFADVISLQDSFNTLTSEELNSYSSSVDSYLVIKGAEATTSAEFQDMKQNRTLLLSENSDAHFLVKNVNPQQWSALRDSVESNLKFKLNIPDYTTSTQGRTGAEMLKLVNIELDSSKLENTLRSGIMKRLRLIGASGVELVFNRTIKAMLEEQSDFDRGLQMLGSRALTVETFLTRFGGFTAEEARQEWLAIAQREDMDILGY
ncbi:MAG: phage portal protein [Bacillaceae bacterium]|nr:phage portal protein [Bacillaceae bacterium]